MGRAAVKGGYLFRIGSKVERIYRGSCDDCRFVGPPQRDKMSARVDLEVHRRAAHEHRPLDPRDES